MNSELPPIRLRHPFRRSRRLALFGLRIVTLFLMFGLAGILFRQPVRADEECVPVDAFARILDERTTKFGGIRYDFEARRTEAVLRHMEKALRSDLPTADRLMALFESNSATIVGLVKAGQVCRVMVVDPKLFGRAVVATIGK
jgi:hypothetical protein